MKANLRTLRRTANRLFWRLYPFYSGKYKMVTSKLFNRAVGTDRSGKTYRCRLANGPQICLTLDDLEGRAIYYTGGWDGRVPWLATAILRPGDVCVDIGANFGEFTLTAAAAVGPKGRVHSFEPQPRLVQLLKESLQANNFDNTFVHDTALSDSSGEMELYIPRGHHGAASLRQKNNASHSHIKVQVSSGDDFFLESGIANVRLMKIDVEGHEASVLNGLRGVFASSPPDVVIFESSEWHTRDVGEFSSLPTVKFFRENNYVLYGFGRSLFRVKVVPIDYDEASHPPTSDIIAVHVSKQAAVTKKIL